MHRHTSGPDRDREESAHGIHEFLLPFFPCFLRHRLALLTAELLHSVPCHELLPTKPALSDCLHFQHSFDGLTYNSQSPPPCPSCNTLVNWRQRCPHCDSLRIRPPFIVLSCHSLSPFVNRVRKMTKSKTRKFLAVEIRCKNILKFGYHQIPATKC